MKYLIYGAGGTGGCLAAFLAQGGKDVSLIARGAHLEAIQKNGLVLETGHGTFAVPVEAREQEQVTEKPDVIFVCVKGYSLEGTLPTLKRLSDGHTIVIPLLNLYGTGARLQPELSPALVTDGCIYIAAEIKAPGTIHMSGDIFRVVFGPRTPEEYRPELAQVERDLRDCGIQGELSRDIQRDALLKFSVVSRWLGCRRPVSPGRTLRSWWRRSAPWPPPWAIPSPRTRYPGILPSRTPWPRTPPPP